MTTRVEYRVGCNISTAFETGTKTCRIPSLCRGITCSVWQHTVVKAIFEVTLCSVSGCDIDCKKEEDFVRTWVCCYSASWVHFQPQKFVLIPLQVVLVPHDELSCKSLAKFTQRGYRCQMWLKWFTLLRVFLYRNTPFFIFFRCCVWAGAHLCSLWIDTGVQRQALVPRAGDHVLRRERERDWSRTPTDWSGLWSWRF